MLHIDGHELSIPQVIDFLVDNRKYIDPADLDRLAKQLNMPVISQGVDEAESVQVGSLDLLMEVQEQMVMVRTLRRNISAMGKAASTKDLKDLISTSTSLFSMLTKLHDDVLNQDRLRKIENATIKAIEGLPVEVRNRFFDALEEYLDE